MSKKKNEFEIPEEKGNKKNKKEGKVKAFFKSFTVKQLIWFIISVTLIAFGVIFLTLGLIDDYTNFYNSPLTTPNESMQSMMGGIGFTWFGVIVTVIAAIILAFTLSIASKGEDRQKEKEARRRQRLEGLSTSSSATSQSTAQVYTGSSIASETKKEEVK